ncbi:MAG: class I SAM-dependent methyltransferase, partial [Acidimicrobiia bacterium]
IMPLARVRFTEDELSLAYAQGCEQYVLLGAGLDTFAYRSPLASHLDVYELDTRETQAGKLRRAAAAGIGPIGKVRHAAIDFEHERLDSTLIAHGLDPQRATFVAWLGVSYYLTDEAIRSTLAAITRLSGVKWMTLDYFRPRTTWDEAMHAGATRAALTREPWITTFDDAMIDALLTDHGFGVGDRIDGPEAAARYPTDVELVPTVATSSVLARRHQ